MVIKKQKEIWRYSGVRVQDLVVVVAFALPNAPVCRQTARVYADGCFPTGRLRCVAGSSWRKYWWTGDGANVSDRECVVALRVIHCSLVKSSSVSGRREGEHPRAVMIT